MKATSEGYIGQDLDDLATKLLRAANSLFSLGATETDRTCTVEEMELSALNRPPTPGQALVCSMAQVLLSKNATNHLRFRCCCERKHDDAVLHYRAVPDISVLCEEIGAAPDRTWNVVLLKPSTRATVVLRLTLHTGALTISRRIQVLCDKWGFGFITHRHQNKPDLHAKDAVGPEGDLTARCSVSQPIPIREATITYRDGSETTYAFPQPANVHMQHLLGARRSSDNENFFGFLPQSSFQVLVASQILSNTDKSTDQTCYIFSVLQETVIEHERHPQGPLYVSLHNVRIGDGFASSVCLGFDHKSDAHSFASYVKKMRKRLLELRFQGPLISETVIYSKNIPTGQTSPSMQSTVEVSMIQNQLSSRFILCNTTHSEFISFEFSSMTLSEPQQNFDGFLSNSRMGLLNDHGISYPSLPRWSPPALPDYSSVRLAQNGIFLKSLEMRRSEDWFHDVDPLLSAMGPPRQAGEVCKRVRVAVIDTGLDKAYHTRYHVKEWKDFVNIGASEMSDKTGHGTLCAHLILSMCEEIDLYVARIFDRDTADPEQGPRLMAQAIEWAIDPQRKVDIISISAGFSQHSSVLQSALTEANYRGALIFAAAANWGNLNKVAVPARNSFKTICIFSTNTHDQPSQFNPEPREGADNFAILGEDLLHPSDPQRRHQGTSMANAIAAGLAALILGFSHHPDNAGIFRVQDVGTKEGMSSIFHSMSKPAGRFQCVSPMDLMPQDFLSRNQAKNREYVRESIHRAMERAQ